jgi:hypothetical protein
MPGGMEDVGFAAAQQNLQIARNRTVRVDGLWYKAQPWGLVGDMFLAPVFRAFARERHVDDSVGFLWDVNKEPSLLLGQPLSANRSDYYYNKYLEKPDGNLGEGEVSTLNLLPTVFDEAEALFGPGVAAAHAQDVKQLQREFLVRVASSVNDYLIAVGVDDDFRKCPGFGAHHAANLARQPMPSRPAAAKAAPGPRRLVQNSAHKVLRFGKKG